MRKALSMLGAIAALAVGSLFAAPPAQAQATVACITYPTPPIENTSAPNINSWPRTRDTTTSLPAPGYSHMYYCSNDTAQLNNPPGALTWVWQSAQTIGTSGGNSPQGAKMAQLFRDNHQRVYLFETLAQLNAYWGTNYAAPAGTNILGVTLASADPHNPNIPVGSVAIIRLKADGTANAQQTVDRTVYHELGHAFDRLKAFPSTNQLSEYNINLNNDIYDINHQTRASVFQGVAIPASCQDKFDDPWDPANPQATLNWEVAKCVFSGGVYMDQGVEKYVTNDMTEPHLFANFFAKRLGGSIVNTALGNWINGKFADTLLYIDHVAAGTSNP